MVSMLVIGVATAVLICAITAKVLLDAPEKANKSEKAEIMKQLLTLSDSENKISGTAPAARLRPLSKQGTSPGGTRKTIPRISQTLRTR